MERPAHPLILLATLGLLAACQVTSAHDGPPTVPPGDEIVILDPHVDSEGKPRPLVTDVPNGGSQIEIPPTVLVHRFYYTGDRDFQGPMMPGGPCVIVGNHPVTGRQFSVSVQMLPGAPRVYYRHDSIRYEFSDACIKLHFGHLTGVGIACEPKVIIHSGTRWKREVAEHAVQVKDDTHAWIERTGLPHAVEHVHTGTVDAVHKSADIIHDTGEIVVAPVTRIWESSPLGSLFRDTVEERATRERDAAVQRAQRASERLEGSIRTLR